jgi:hypothetical protein
MLQPFGRFLGSTGDRLYLRLDGGRRRKLALEYSLDDIRGGPEIERLGRQTHSPIVDRRPIRR